MPKHIQPFMLLMALVFANPTGASCLEKYNRLLGKIVLSPVTGAVSSLAQSSVGAASTTGGGLLGTVLLNEEISSAGFLYGAAFFYEGQYIFDNTFNNIRQFKNRDYVRKVLKEARNGIGDHLEELLDDINDSVITGMFLELEELTQFLQEADKREQFCLPGDVLPTRNGLLQFVLENY